MSSPSSPSGAPAASAPLQLPPPPPLVKPEPDSRLDQLLARYDQAKLREKAAKEEADAITAGIKAELSRMHPGTTEVLVHSPHLSAPLQLKAIPKFRFDSKGCKASHPHIYAAFAKSSTEWRLTRLVG